MVCRTSQKRICRIITDQKMLKMITNIWHLMKLELESSNLKLTRFLNNSKSLKISSRKHSKRCLPQSHLEAIWVKMTWQRIIPFLECRVGLHASGTRKSQRKWRGISPQFRVWLCCKIRGERNPFTSISMAFPETCSMLRVGSSWPVSWLLLLKINLTLSTSPNKKRVLGKR